MKLPFRLSVAPLLLCLLSACGPSLEDGAPSPSGVTSAFGYYADGGTYMAEQSLTVKAAGLWTNANALDAPPGSLEVARNAAIRRPGIIEQRRGEKPDATTSNGAFLDALTTFDGKVIAHDEDDFLYYRASDTTLTALSGSYAPPTDSTTRYATMLGGLFVTTDDGLVRMDSSTSTPLDAGVPPGLEGSGTVTGSSGWLGLNESTAYRLVWGYRTDNGRVLLGAPSGRLLVTNLVQNSPIVSFTWTRAAAVITVTSAAHGLTTGDTISVSTSTDESAIPLASYTVTVTGVNTFTMTGVDAGAASGGGGYAVGVGTRDVVIVTPVPDGIVYGRHFLQVYRTVNTSTGGTDPGDEMAQSGEFFPTSSQVSAGFVTIRDIASFPSGATAYFSSGGSGYGLLDVHDPPPVLTDMTEFQGHMVGVVQKYTQTLQLSLLAVDGTSGLDVGEGLIFNVGGVFSFSVSAEASENVSLGQFQLYTSGTASQNIENTARSMVRMINGYANSTLYATYASGANDLPGRVILSARSPGSAEFSVLAFGSALPWSPGLGSRLYVTSISRAGTTVSATVAPPDAVATLEAGDQIELTTSPDADFPLGVKTVVSVNTGTGVFTYTEAGAAGAGTGALWVFETTDGAYAFNQDASDSSYALSIYREPDSFPPRLRYDVAADDSTLYRITKQGEALNFWTSIGLYRFTGNTENDFTLRPFDPTCRLIAPNTVATLGNKTYALTDTGVAEVTESGVNNVSGPIEETLRAYYSTTEANLTRTAEAAFAFAYESEGEYVLFLPDLAGNPGDPATKAYVYNINNGTWVGPWDFSWAGVNDETGFVKTGFVSSIDSRIYLASVDRLFRERKDRAASDYQDDTGSGIPLDVAYTVNTARNPGAYKQWIESTMLMSYAQPASIYAYFKTELDTEEEGGTISTQGNLAPRTYVPLNKSRSARLTVGMRHSTAAEQCTVLGISQTYNVASTRVGR